MRDTIRDTTLNELIDEISDSIRRIDLKINNNDVRKDRLESVLRFKFHNYLELTIGNFSIGSPKKSIKPHFLNTIHAFEQGFSWEGFEHTYGGYDEIIWMISLGILCDIEIEDFLRITARIKKFKVEDSLLNFLIKSKQPEWNQSGSYIIQKSPYGKLESLIKETSEAKGVEQLKNYLKKEWYKGHNDAAWYDSHKNTKVNNYFGYWAWETAAIVKAKGWDDTELKDQLYYPYDAVHW